MKEKIENIVKIFLLSCPFLDMITAFTLHYLKTSITIGVIVRFLFLFFSLVYLFFFYHGKEKKKYLLLASILSLYLSIFLLSILCLKGTSAFLYEGQNAVKTFYFPYLLLCFAAMMEEKLNVFPKKYFSYLLAVYLLGLFIPNFLGIGFGSYEVTKGGNLGFFYTANEVGGILSLLMPFFLLQLYQEKNILKMILYLGIFLYVLLTMGTKGPILSLFLILLVWFCILMKKLIKRKEYKIIGVISGIVLSSLLCFFVIVPYTPFYKNMRVHLDFLEVDHVTDIFQDVKLVDHFVFSSRLKFMTDSYKNYSKASLLEKFIGMGYIEAYGTDHVRMKMVEMDYVDLFFRHGILGFLIYMGIYLSFFYQAIKRRRKEKDKLLKVSYYLSYLLSVLLAIFTGHILTAPSVSLLVVLLLTVPKGKELIT